MSFRGLLQEFRCLPLLAALAVVGQSERTWGAKFDPHDVGNVLARLASDLGLSEDVMRQLAVQQRLPKSGGPSGSDPRPALGVIGRALQDRGGTAKRLIVEAPRAGEARAVRVLVLGTNSRKHFVDEHRIEPDRVRDGQVKITSRSGIWEGGDGAQQGRDAWLAGESQVGSVRIHPPAADRMVEVAPAPKRTRHHAQLGLSRRRLDVVYVPDRHGNQKQTLVDLATGREVQLRGGIVRQGRAR